MAKLFLNQRNLPGLIRTTLNPFGGFHGRFGFEMNVSNNGDQANRVGANSLDDVS